ncbi:MAG: 50S ribosomal protein L9 [Pseudomonadota bacterium]|nr:50S ribosomal protein L9 [Pseudomonadota bacterium]
MEIILLKKVGHLGGLGEKVSVRPGYGRNYLIPAGYAAAATEANLKAFEERRAELEREAEQGLAAAQTRRGELDGLTVTLARKAGDEGRLFGSVGTADIAAAVQDLGLKLEKQEVRLPEGALRAAGEYEVVVHLYADVDATLKLEIVPEK